MRKLSVFTSSHTLILTLLQMCSNPSLPLLEVHRRHRFQITIRFVMRHKQEQSKKLQSMQMGEVHQSRYRIESVNCSLREQLFILKKIILLGMKISYVQFDTKINGSHFSFSENLTQILHE